MSTMGILEKAHRESTLLLTSRLTIQLLDNLGASRHGDYMAACQDGDYEKMQELERQAGIGKHTSRSTNAMRDIAGVEFSERSEASER